MKKPEARQRIESAAKKGQEILELGEQRLKEAEERQFLFSEEIEIFDDECMSAVSSQFGYPSEEICCAITAFDDTAIDIAEIKNGTNSDSGLEGISEKEIHIPDMETPLFSTTDEMIERWVKELEDLEKAFD